MFAEVVEKFYQPLTEEEKAMSVDDLLKSRFPHLKEQKANPTEWQMGEMFARDVIVASIIGMQSNADKWDSVESNYYQNVIRMIEANYGENTKPFKA